MVFHDIELASRLGRWMGVSQYVLSLARLLVAFVQQDSELNAG